MSHRVRMGGVRYRAYVVRVWLSDDADPAGARMRIEWIAPGIEVETLGEPAADLAARLERVFDPDAAADGGPREQVALTGDQGRL